jgi:hypothetical protein
LDNGYGNSDEDRLLAWIAYVNKGSITDASGTSQQNWLESGFLRKRDGTWEMVFLHSTRVPMKPEQANGK